MSRSKCLIACVVAHTVAISLGCQRSTNGPSSSPEDFAESAEVELTGFSGFPEPEEAEVEVTEFPEFPEPEDFEDDVPGFHEEQLRPPTPPQPPRRPANFDYQVVRENADGSHDIEVTVATTTRSTRTRIELGQDGQERQVAYEVVVPVTRTMLITAPPHVVDIEQYLADQLAN